VLRGNRLLSYFQSGWAFLLPYLSAYLLYAWQKWPANSSDIGNPRWIPSLLHVFWSLHILHLAAATLALAVWYRSIRSKPAFRAVIQPVLPWLLLGLLFWIPGPYFEWPSDPWEHLRRAVAWSEYDTVAAHPELHKSSYFLLYSLLPGDPAAQSVALRFYHSAVCLLLGWQYYRLARSLGWETHWALGFVFFNVTLFGNSAFSFYRYYSLSSTIYSQLGAVALVRLVLEWMQWQLAARRGLPLRQQTAGMLARGTAAFLLLSLIAASHLQGVAFAVLGAASICAWAAIAHLPRSRLIGILVLGVLANLAVLWGWPRHPMVDGELISAGWLSRWGTYNLDPWSLAGARTWQILGLLGVADLVCALVLLRRSPPVNSCLTLGPLVWLSMPAFVLPAANLIAGHGPTGVLAFHRMFFAIPAGLSVIALLRHLGQVALRRPRLAWGLAAVAALVCLLVPPDRSAYGRTWHLLAMTPDDLKLDPARRLPVAHPESTGLRVVSPAPLAYARATMGSPTESLPNRVDFNPRDLATQSLVTTLNSQWPPSGSPDDSRATGGPAKDFWSTIEGHPPSFVRATWTDGGTIVVAQNEPGGRSDLLTTTEWQLEAGATYTVEAVVRSDGTPSSANFLGIVWYDAAGRRLDSAVAAPGGGGSPSGWENGSYSYFGLNGTSPPPAWTIYRKSFGAGTWTAIPAQARTFRAAARINHAGTPNARVQIASFQVSKQSPGKLQADGAFRSDDRLQLLIAAPTLLYSAGSTAARISNHWLPYQLALDLNGTRELIAVAQAREIPVRTVTAHSTSEAPPPATE
jgi:hypothetical protein